MDYKIRAKKWFKRAVRERDKFIKFILLFITLEVLVKIEGIPKRQIKNRSYLFIDISKKDLQQLIKELSCQPLQNKNLNGDMRWNGKITSTSDTDGIIEFILRGRNNLFHGDKGPDEDRDLLIVTYGNKLLEPIVSKMFEIY